MVLWKLKLLPSTLGLETLQGLQNKLITRISQCKDVKTLSTLCSTLAALHVYSTELPIGKGLGLLGCQGWLGLEGVFKLFVAKWSQWHGIDIFSKMFLYF